MITDLIISKILLSLPKNEYFPNHDGLRLLITQWIEVDEYTVVDYGSDQFGTLRLVTKEEGEYTLFRFFPIGDRWSVSVDDHCVSPDTIITSLIKNQD